MAEEIALENGRISFEGLVTLTLDQSYCIPSCITHLPTWQLSIKSKKHFVDRRMHGTNSPSRHID